MKEPKRWGEAVHVSGWLGRGVTWLIVASGGVHAVKVLYWVMDFAIHAWTADVFRTADQRNLRGDKENDVGQIR